MAALCVVPECPGSTRGKQRGEKIYFFKVQVDQVLEWSNLIPGNVKLSVNDKLCSRHFEEEDIMKDWVFDIDGQKVTMPRGRWALKVGAVPKIFGCYKDEYKPITPRTRPVPKINSEDPSTVETPLRIRKRKPKPNTQSPADNSSEEEAHKKRSKNPTPVRETDAKPAKRRRDSNRSNPLTKKTGSKQDISSSFDDDGPLCIGFLSGSETTPVNVEERRVSDVDEAIEKGAFDENSDRTVVPSIPSMSRQIPAKIVVKKEKYDEDCWTHDLEPHDLPERSTESSLQVQGCGWEYEGVVVKREMCDCDKQCTLPSEECDHTVHPTTVIFDEELSQTFEGTHEHVDSPCSPSLIEENGVTLKFSMPESVIASSKFSFVDLEETAFKLSTAQINTVPISSAPSLRIEQDSGISAADVIIDEDEITSQTDSPDESSQCATLLLDSHESGIPVLDSRSTSKIDCNKLAIEIPLPEITITPVVAACSKTDENPCEIDPKSMAWICKSDLCKVSHGSVSDFQLQIEPAEQTCVGAVPPIDIQSTVSVSELQSGFVGWPSQLDTQTTGPKELEETKTSELNFENGAEKLEENQYFDGEMDFLGFKSDEDEELVEKWKHFQNSSDMAVKSANIYSDKLQEKCKLTADTAGPVSSKTLSDISPQAQPHVDEPTVRKALEQLKELAPRTKNARKTPKTSNHVKVKPGHHNNKSVMKNVATALEKASKDMVKDDLVRNGMRPEIKNSKIRRPSTRGENASKDIIKNGLAINGMKPEVENNKIPRNSDCGEISSKDLIKNDPARNGMKSEIKNSQIPRTSNRGEDASKNIINNGPAQNGMKSGSEDSKIPHSLKFGQLKNVTISSNPSQRPGKSTRCSENIVTVEKVTSSPSHQVSHKGSPPIKCGQTSLDRFLQSVDTTTPSANRQVVHKGIPRIKSSLDRILQAVDTSTPSQIRDPAADKTSLILKNFKSDGVLALECVVLREQVRRLQKELFLQKQLLVDSEHNASLLQRKLELQSQLPCPKCASFRPVIGKETLI